MIKAGILALLAAAAQAQTVAAGARAVVTADALPVYLKMSQGGDVAATLKRGDIVTIGLVLFDTEITWCAISRPGETKRLGFASCEFLESDRSSKAVEPPGLTPPPEPKPVMVPEPAPPPKPKPATPEHPKSEIRNPTAPVPEPVPAPAPPPPKPPAPKPEPADFVDSVLDGLGLRLAIANYTRTTRLLSFLDKGRLAE